MSIAVLSQATAALALAALGIGPTIPDLLPVQETLHVVFQTGEGQQILGAVPKQSEAPLAHTLVTEPAHGEYREVDAETFTYEPDSGFFGRDRFVIVAEFPRGTTLIEVEIDVLPRYYPLVGRWKGGSSYYAGYYDSLQNRLVTCSDVPANAALSCRSQGLGGMPKGGIPIVLPTAPNQAEQVGIFFPSSGTLYRWGLRDNSFYLWHAATYPEAMHHFPVVGNWSGLGESLAFVDRDGDVISYRTASLREDWPKVLGDLRADQLTWPVRFPLDDYDAVALAEPETHFFPWQTLNADTGVDWFSPRLDVRRPIHWPGGVPSLDVGGARVLFVLIESPDGQLSLFGYDFDDGKPSTIPITFPNDPPSG